MRNYILLLAAGIFFIGCQQEKNFVSFSGKIENRHSDSIIVFHPKVEYTKIIKLNEDGYFKDTLQVKDGIYSFTDGREFTMLYLKKGETLVMNYNTKYFSKSLNFKGDYPKENRFLATSLQKENDLLLDTKLMRKPKIEFDSIITDYVNQFNNRLNSVELDTCFKEFENNEINNFKNYITNSYLKTNYNKLVLGKGKPSPIFKDYENFKGGTTSLSDFKGKYLFIDVWATWCKPCKNEIPYLQKLEKKYLDKNISFISISVDDQKGYEAWREMVTEKNMSGVQLYAKGDSKFSNDYRIISIPRFILIDPEGKIIDANAPKPSSPLIRNLLGSLNL